MFVEGLESSFQLPPAAVSLPISRDSGSSPASPEMPNTSTSTGTKRPALEGLCLPPPPTRTRKIIQMKPKTQNSPPSSKPGKSSSQEATNKSSTGNSKKKQAGGSTAGRKVARKTAHSLIERRRRSKMNEEFATLKNMIPACEGQDMHKLSILQVGVFFFLFKSSIIA